MTRRVLAIWIFGLLLLIGIVHPEPAAAATCANPAWLIQPPEGVVQQSCLQRAWGQMNIPLADGPKTLEGAWSVQVFAKSNPQQVIAAAALRAPVIEAATQAGAVVVSKPDRTDVTMKLSGPDGDTYVVYAPRGNSDNPNGFVLTTLHQIPLPQEVEARAITAPLDVAAPCADPPWLLRGPTNFARGACKSKNWALQTLASLTTPDKTLEGKRLTVTYAVTASDKAPTSILLQRNFMAALKSAGATIVSRDTDTNRVVATQTTPVGEVWYIYRAGDGNDESRGSFSLITYVIQPFQQEVQAQPMTAPLVAGAPCADPPWLLHGLAAYHRRDCESRDWDMVRADGLTGGNKLLEGRRVSVFYDVADPAHAPPSVLLQRNYLAALKAIGATIVTKETEIDRIVATQNTPAGEVWYLYQSGSGNSENMGSYRLTTVAIAPFPREVEVRSMPDGLQQPGKTCANPPWLVRQFASYRLDRCDYQDFAPLKIELPGGPKELSGRVMVTKYVLADPPHIRLPIAIWRNYVTALQEIGAKLVTDPKNTSLAVLTQTDGAGEYWYIYRNAGGNDEGTSGYSLSTLQIGGPPPKACTIQVYGVNFDFDKSVLRPDSEPVLLQVLALFTAMPSFSAEVGGHTDNVGQPPYNLKLSDARAAAVKTWLTQHGVAPTRLSSRGYGDTRPLVPNTSDENRFKNRRVELKRPNCS